jgi:hypothetical protein
MIEEALTYVVGDLHDRRLPWALVGGLAVCARAEPRPTADIDIAVVTADDATAKAYVDDLLAVGYRWKKSIANAQTGRLATVKLDSPAVAKDVAVDLFLASCGVERGRGGSGAVGGRAGSDDPRRSHRTSDRGQAPLAAQRET